MTAHPKRIRLRFFRNRKLLSKLARCSWETMRDLLQAALGRDDVVPGAVICPQTFGNLLDPHPHTHEIITWGCFDAQGNFLLVDEVPDEKVVEKLFRHKVFKMLLEEDAISEEIIENMLQWHHTGFSVHIGRPVEAHDDGGTESLAQYVVRGAVVLEDFSGEKRLP